MENNFTKQQLKEKRKSNIYKLQKKRRATKTKKKITSWEILNLKTIILQSINPKKLYCIKQNGFVAYPSKKIRQNIHK